MLQIILNMIKYELEFDTNIQFYFFKIGEEQFKGRVSRDKSIKQTFLSIS